MSEETRFDWGVTAPNYRTIEAGADGAAKASSTPANALSIKAAITLQHRRRLMMLRRRIVAG